LQAWGYLPDPVPTVATPFQRDFTIFPTPGANYWNGLSGPGIDRMRVELTFFPGTGKATIRSTVYHDGLSIIAYQWNNVVPVSTQPFCSGLMSHTFHFPDRRIQCYIVE